MKINMYIEINKRIHLGNYLKKIGSIMDSSTRNSLCHQIHVFLQKFPDASTFQIKEFILKGSQGEVNLSGVSQNTLKKFIIYQKNKVTKSRSLKCYEIYQTSMSYQRKTLGGFFCLTLYIRLYFKTPN